MCVLVGHPGTRLGVPSRCGNFFCWGNSGWRRWILSNSAILNSDTKICFSPRPILGWKSGLNLCQISFLKGTKMRFPKSHPSCLACPAAFPAGPCASRARGAAHGAHRAREKEIWRLEYCRAKISYPPGPASEFWCILMNFDGFWWILAPRRALLCRAWEHPQSRSPKELD